MTAVATVSAQLRIGFFNPDTLHKATGYSHVGQVLGEYCGAIRA